MDMRDEILVVGEFEIRWEPGHDSLRVVARRRDGQGYEAAMTIEGPPASWPPREQIEHVAVEHWHAMDNLRRIADGQPPVR